jgi:site-specific recombinase XerD
LIKTVAGARRGEQTADGSELRCRGQRKYLNYSERLGLAKAAQALAPRRRLFVLTLLWTGGRVSEVLSIRASDIDVAEGLVSLRTLKRRRPHIREVPLPPDVMCLLEEAFRLTASQSDPDRREDRLFPWSRSTAWRLIKQLCARARISGIAAMPKGMRHGFGVGTLQAGVPMTLVQRWLGHARLSTTAIYTDVVGAEEKAFARQFWAWRPKVN